MEVTLYLSDLVLLVVMLVIFELSDFVEVMEDFVDLVGFKDFVLLEDLLVIVDIVVAEVFGLVLLLTDLLVSCGIFDLVLLTLLLEDL